MRIKYLNMFENLILSKLKNKDHLYIHYSLFVNESGEISISSEIEMVTEIEEIGFTIYGDKTEIIDEILEKMGGDQNGRNLNGDIERRLVVGGSFQEQQKILPSLKELSSMENSRLYFVPPYLERIDSPDIEKSEVVDLLNHLDEINEQLYNFNRFFDKGETEEIVQDFYTKLIHLHQKYCPEIPVTTMHYPADKMNTAAGVFPIYCDSTGTNFVLLGKMNYKDRGWVTLGGESDPDDDSLENTASREVYEESGDRLIIPSAKLRNCPYHELRTTTQNGSYLFRMYVYECDEEIDVSNLRYHEFSDYAWVPLGSLVAALDATSHENLSKGEMNLNINGGWQPVHNSFVKMLAQAAVREHINKLASNESYVKKYNPETEKYHFKSPVEERNRIGRLARNQAGVLLELKTRFFKPKVPDASAIGVCQSDLYLRAVMPSEKYQEGALRDNIKTFCENISSFKDSKFLKENGVIDHLCEIVEKEEEANAANRLVFYHATNSTIGFIMGFFTELRQRLALIPGNQFKAFRGIDNYFKTLSRIDDLISAFNQRGSIYNYSSYYQEAGVSINPFLFGNDGVTCSSSLYLYLTNSTMHAPNIESLLQQVLVGYEVDDTFIKALLNLYKKHHLAREENGGHLYQFIIDKKAAEKYIYMAGSMGVLAPLIIDGRETYSPVEILNEIIKDPQKYKSYIENIEARILVNPELMENQELLQINEYTRFDHPATYKEELSDIVDSMLDSILSSPREKNVFISEPALIRQVRYRLDEEGLSQKPANPALQIAVSIRKGEHDIAMQMILEHPEVDILKLPNPAPDSNEYSSYSRVKKTVTLFDLLKGNNFNKYWSYFAEHGKSDACSIFIKQARLGNTGRIKTLTVPYLKEHITTNLESVAKSFDDYIVIRQAFLERSYTITMHSEDDFIKKLDEMVIGKGYLQVWLEQLGSVKQFLDLTNRFTADYLTSRSLSCSGYWIGHILKHHILADTVITNAIDYNTIYLECNSYTNRDINEQQVAINCRLLEKCKDKIYDSIDSCAQMLAYFKSVQSTELTELDKVRKASEFCTDAYSSYKILRALPQNSRAILLEDKWKDISNFIISPQDFENIFSVFPTSCRFRSEFFSELADKKLVELVNDAISLRNVLRNLTPEERTYAIKKIGYKFLKSLLTSLNEFNLLQNCLTEEIKTSIYIKEKHRFQSAGADLLQIFNLLKSVQHEDEREEIFEFWFSNICDRTSCAEDLYESFDSLNASQLARVLQTVANSSDVFSYQNSSVPPTIGKHLDFILKLSEEEAKHYSSCNKELIEKIKIRGELNRVLIKLQGLSEPKLSLALSGLTVPFTKYILGDDYYRPEDPFVHLLEILKLYNNKEQASTLIENIFSSNLGIEIFKNTDRLLRIKEEAPSFYQLTLGMCIKKLPEYLDKTWLEDSNLDEELKIKYCVKHFKKLWHIKPEILYYFASIAPLHEYFDVIPGKNVAFMGLNTDEQVVIYNKLNEHQKENLISEAIIQKPYDLPREKVKDLLNKIYPNDCLEKLLPDLQEAFLRCGISVVKDDGKFLVEYPHHDHVPLRTWIQSLSKIINKEKNDELKRDLTDFKSKAIDLVNKFNCKIIGIESFLKSATAKLNLLETKYDKGRTAKMVFANLDSVVTRSQPKVQRI